MRVTATYKFVILAIILIVFMKMCGTKADGDWTGRVYMPDMFYSQAYETYSPSPSQRRPENVNTNLTNYKGEIFADGLIARQPVKNTIARGNMPYPYENTDEGYEKAGNTLVNPYGRGDKTVLAEGKELYKVYCEVCHGKKGDGKGSISATNDGPLASIPNYFAAAYLSMQEGKMYHSLQYGKNLMGSYAAQMTKDERWKVVTYVKEMQANKITKDEGVSIDEAYVKTRGGIEEMMNEGEDYSSVRFIGVGYDNVEVSESFKGYSKEVEGHSVHEQIEKEKDGLIKRIVKNVKEKVEDIKENREEKKEEKDHVNDHH